MKYSVLILLLTLFLFGQWQQQISAENAEVGNDGDLKQPSNRNPKKKSTKNWSKVDFSALEKEWEEGDDKNELESEYDISRKVHERNLKKKPSSAKQATRAVKKDPLGLNGGKGGTLMFAKLKEKRKKNVDWTTIDVDKVAARWTSLLRSAGTDVKVVNIGAQGGGESEKNTLLVSVNKAWETSDVVTFVLKQKETSKITLNNRDYTLKDLPSDEDD